MCRWRTAAANQFRIATHESALHVSLLPPPTLPRFVTLTQTNLEVEFSLGSGAARAPPDGVRGTSLPSEPSGRWARVHELEDVAHLN